MALLILKIRITSVFSGETHPERIKKSDRLLVDNYDYTGVEFPVSTKHYSRIEAHNKVNINVLGYENKQVFPIYISTGSH